MKYDDSPNTSEDSSAPSSKYKQMFDGDENPERGNWTSKTEYLLSMIGFTVGLGNIWRFPYLAYKNGGGAFLIPYFISMFVCGIPLYFLESAIGQFCSQGPINMWRAVPLLQGVGFSMAVLNVLVAIYYNVLLAYSFYYMFASFQYPLPWSGCYSWADSSCLEPLVSCNVSGVLGANCTQGNGTFSTSTSPGQSPSEQYWNRVVLRRSRGIDETGPVVWHLALCLLLSSALVAAALVKGVKSSGKVVYFTTTFPYVAILVLLIRGVTLEGSGDGISYFIGSHSNFTKLTEVEVWRDAVTQTFFGLSVAWGAVVTLTSYNNFHNNMCGDSIFVCVLNNGTSVFAGFAIFSILGHMSYIYGRPVESVVNEGFALAFVAYPEALAKLPASPVWSFFFFFMLVTIGLDSLFTLLETINTILCDAFPEKLSHRRGVLSVGTCFTVFFLGLPCVTEAGIYWVNLLDTFGPSWVVLVLALVEITGFCYIYGMRRLTEDIEMMIGKKSNFYWLVWKICWCGVTPCSCAIILVWTLVNYTPLTYGDVLYPAWGQALGWCVTVVILIWIPVVGAYKLITAEGSLHKRVKTLCSPSKDWQPYLEIHRGERYAPEKQTAL